MDPSQQETKKGINKVFIAIVNVQPMIATHVGKMKTCNNETHHSCGEEKKNEVTTQNATLVGRNPSREAQGGTRQGERHWQKK